MNVLLYGMQSSDWELCAGIVDFLPFDYVLVKRRGSVRYWIYRRNAPALLPTFVSSHVINPVTPHFPFGLDVLPD